MKISIEGVKSFIPEATIETLLEQEKNASKERIRDIIQKSLDKTVLDPDETAACSAERSRTPSDIRRSKKAERDYLWE